MYANVHRLYGLRSSSALTLGTGVLEAPPCRLTLAQQIAACNNRVSVRSLIDETRVRGETNRSNWNKHAGLRQKLLERKGLLSVGHRHSAQPQISKHARSRFWTRRKAIRQAFDAGSIEIEGNFGNVSPISITHGIN